jgi:hypothetical protein
MLEERDVPLFALSVSQQTESISVARTISYPASSNPISSPPAPENKLMHRMAVFLNTSTKNTSEFKLTEISLTR